MVLYASDFAIWIEAEGVGEGRKRAIIYGQFPISIFPSYFPSSTYHTDHTDYTDHTDQPAFLYTNIPLYIHTHEYSHLLYIANNPFICSYFKIIFTLTKLHHMLYTVHLKKLQKIKQALRNTHNNYRKCG